MKKPTKKTAAKTVVPIAKAERKPDWKRALRTAKTSPGDERKAALARLGVSAEDLAQAAPITPILKRADGGIAQVIGALRLAKGDKVIAQFFAKYDSISAHDRMHAPIEAIALSAGIDPCALLGSAMLALQSEAAAIIRVMTTSAHPKIIASRIRFGQMPGGDKDRQALDTALGFLPSPKGPTFIGKAIFGSGRNVMDAQRLGDGGDDENEEPPLAAAAGDIDLDRLFPEPRLMQEKLQAIRQRQLLPDPKRVH